MCKKLLCEPYALPFCKNLDTKPHYYCILCINLMYKVHPIRGNCPICKGQFEGEMPSEEKPKKKGEEEVG